MLTAAAIHSGLSSDIHLTDLFLDPQECTECIFSFHLSYLPNTLDFKQQFNTCWIFIYVVLIFMQRSVRSS
jgi:hypothetical protein